MFTRLRDRTRRTSTLSEIELFDQCSPAELREIESLVTAVHVPAGSRLITQGSAPSQFVVLTAGQASVTRTVGADHQELALLGAGAFVGEMAILFGTTRSASVTAQSDVRALVSTPGEFHEMVRLSPSVARRIGDIAATRATALATVA